MLELRTERPPTAHTQLSKHLILLGGLSYCCYTITTNFLPTYRSVTLQLVAPTKGDEADLGHTRKNV